MKISPVALVGLILTLVCLVLYVAGPKFVEAISNYAYDWYLGQVHSDPRSGKVVVIDLDDASLLQHGQWPWARHRVADLTRRIIDGGAAVVGFDIMFSEHDRTSPMTVQKDWKTYFGIDIDLKGFPAGAMDFDSMLADELRRGKTILACSMRPSTKVPDVCDTSKDPFFRSRVVAKAGPGSGVSFEEGEINRFMEQSDSVTISIESLSKASETAFFNSRPGSDGVVRSNPLVWALGPRRIYSSMALEAIRLYINAPQAILYYDSNGVLGIRVNDLNIPTDQSGSIMINYRSVNEDERTGLVSSFPIYSAASVLSGKIPKDALRGKIVFVGTSAVGLKDIRATPLSGYFSGVEIHATIVDNILCGDMLRNPNWMPAVHVAVIILMGAFLTAFISRGKSWLSFLVSVALILLAVKIGLVALKAYHWVFVPTWMILSTIIIYPVLTMIKYWQEELQKKRVRDMFGTMVSSDVLSYLEDNPESFSLSGQKADATMFFSDIAGFTTISENLQPEQLSAFLNHYLSPMTKIIMDRRGYVDKYEGDLIMAEWGVPFPTKDHAVQACMAAIEQQEKLAEIRPVMKEQFGHNLHVRMGLNTGTITAGNMGSDRRFQYTVIGDAVNQAARLEPANKEYGTEILISEATLYGARDAVEARLLDTIIVTGKTKPIQVYELLGRKGKISDLKQRVVALYEKALRAHWDRNWGEALRCLEEALALDPRDTPSARMRLRVIGYRENPPADAWAGEYVRTAKH